MNMSNRKTMKKTIMIIKNIEKKSTHFKKKKRSKNQRFEKT